MSRILLVPGSFNPVTNAHIDIALDAKRAIRADHVFFIPAHDSYVARKGVLIPGEHRAELINTAPVCMLEWMVATDIEIKSFFPQRTYDTIEQIRNKDEEQFKFNEYYICLGTDDVATLPLWYNWRKLVENYHFVACTRNEMKLEDALCCFE